MTNNLPVNFDGFELAGDSFPAFTDTSLPEAFSTFQPVVSSIVDCITSCKTAEEQGYTERTVSNNNCTIECTRSNNERDCKIVETKELWETRRQTIHEIGRLYETALNQAAEYSLEDAIEGLKGVVSEIMQNSGLEQMK